MRGIPLINRDTGPTEGGFVGGGYIYIRTNQSARVLLYFFYTVFILLSSSSIFFSIRNIRDKRFVYIYTSGGLITYTTLVAPPLPATYSV